MRIAFVVSILFLSPVLLFALLVRPVDAEDDTVSACDAPPSAPSRLCCTSLRERAPGLHDARPVFTATAPEEQRWSTVMASANSAQDAPAAPDESAEEASPRLVVYADADFSGRSLTITDTLIDMPKSDDFDWNDQISSIEVLEGTWRLYEHGRLHQLRERKRGEPNRVGGWSCVITAPARISGTDGRFGDNSISSIERIANHTIPLYDEDAPTRSPRLEVYTDTGFRGRRLSLRKNSGRLQAFERADGTRSSWDDNISSLKVFGGTWRLRQYELNEDKTSGWSCLVSPRGHRPLLVSRSEHSSWGGDSISSIELVSKRSLRRERQVRLSLPDTRRGTR